MLLACRPRSPKGRKDEGGDPAESRKRLERIGKRFKDVLNLPASESIELSGHADSAHAGSSRAKAKFTV